MRAVRRFLVAALGLLALATVLLAAAWAVDTRSHEGKALRNVTLAGRDVGGMTRPQLLVVAAEMARRLRGAPLEVDAPGGGFSVGAGEIGLVVEEQASADAALAAGRRGTAVERLRSWVTSFLQAKAAEVAVRVDEAVVRRVVSARDRGRKPPREPSIKVDENRLVPVRGAMGRGIDAAAVIEAVPEAARHGLPMTVRVDRGAVPPRFSMADAERVARAGEAVAAQPLAVTVDGHAASVDPASLRSWLTAVPTDGGLQLTVDAGAATAGLSSLLPQVGTPPVETTFEVVGGVPRIVAGRSGTACCAPEAGTRLDQAVQARLAGTGAEPVALPVKQVEPELTVPEAEALGIAEPVGSFTTNHLPGQPRVANIHRIADLLRGQVIAPGKTFSVNDFVGKRTTEKGFVVDAVIEDGMFTESVGGGISQFATTAFNAAFFAGLEFGEYQSHSIYISRYPYGREATLSFPHPDLKIRNPSPYGVLIWPTYTERSITVTLYSTRWADVAQTAQTKEQRGPCTRVRTERTRRILSDGAVKVDHVGALYRPAEGVKCT